MRTFADTLKKEREELGISQIELGQKLNCTRYRIADLERGKTAPTIEDLNLLCDLFGVSSDYLIGRTEVRSTQENPKMICKYTGLSETAFKKMRFLARFRKEGIELPKTKELDGLIWLLTFQNDIFSVLNHLLTCDDFYECLLSLASGKNMYQEISDVIAKEDTTNIDPEGILKDCGDYAEESEYSISSYEQQEQKARYHHLNALEIFRAIADDYLKEDREKAKEDIAAISSVPF